MTPFQLSENVIKNLAIKDVDLLLTGYSGAGPYPQCFENLSKKNKIIEGKKKKEKFLDMSMSYIKSTKAKYYIPFAGTYYLAGKLAKLQNKRGVPSIDEAYNKIDKLIEINKLSTKSIKLNYETDLSLKNYNLSKVYKPIKKKLFNNFINKISKKKLNYEKLKKVETNEILNLSRTAFEKYKLKK